MYGVRTTVLITLLLFLLAACGPLGASPTATPEATSTPHATATRSPITPVPQAMASPEPTPAPDTLTLWTTERADGLAFVRALAREFGEREEVIVEVVPKSAGGLRADMIAIELAGGSLPDLVWGDQDDLAGLLADNQLQPIEPIEAPEAFLPASITSATYQDQIWGQPIAVQHFLLLLYNRALIGAPPRTTDELIAQARAVQGGEQYGITAAWSEARWLLPWLNGFGGAPTTPDGMQPTLDTPAMISALNLLLELRAAAPPDQRSYTEGSTLFGLGQVALTIDGDWSLETYRNIAPPLDLGIAPLPQIPATGRIAAGPAGSTYLMFHRGLDGPQLEDARSFARFLAEPTGQVRLAGTLKRLPALRVALADAAITTDELLGAAAAQAESAPGLPPTKGLRCALRAINGQLPLLLDGQIDQAQAADAMQQSADACLMEE